MIRLNYEAPDLPDPSEIEAIKSAAFEELKKYQTQKDLLEAKLIEVTTGIALSKEDSLKRAYATEAISVSQSIIDLIDQVVPFMRETLNKLKKLNVQGEIITETSKFLPLLEAEKEEKLKNIELFKKVEKGEDIQ